MCSLRVYCLQQGVNYSAVKEFMTKFLVVLGSKRELIEMSLIIYSSKGVNGDIASNLEH